MTSVPPPSTTNTSIAESETGSVPVSNIIEMQEMKPTSSGSGEATVVGTSGQNDKDVACVNDDGWWDEFIPESERRNIKDAQISILWRMLKNGGAAIAVAGRKVVSQNRRRYQNDGFNMDLSYITERIIAMGYPAKKLEMLYRNNMPQVRELLEKFHPGHYLVFNLRGEPGFMYDPKYFNYRLVQYIMADHHPPRLEYMAPLCRQIDEYLKRSPQNVVALHCKAGKGRTGVMICAYLCFIKYFDNPRQIMDYYSIIRTKDNKGVTIPSQRRYIYYFNALRELRLNYLPPRIQLVGIYIERPPIIRGKLFVEVRNTTVEIRTCQPIEFPNDEESKQRSFKRFLDPEHDTNLISRRCYGWSFPKEPYNAQNEHVKPVYLEGDVRINLRADYKLTSLKRDRKIGHVWFNTMFVCDGYLGVDFNDGDKKRSYEKNAPEKSMVVFEEDSSAGQSTSGERHAIIRDKKDKTPVKPENVVIVNPPKFKEHCPDEFTTAAPYEKPIRQEIDQMLRTACTEHLVQDRYAINESNIRDRPNDPVVGRSPTSIAVSVGSAVPTHAVEPVQLVRDPECHYQFFAKHDIDRACKNNVLDERCRLIIVTRCVRGDAEAKMALEEVKPKREEQFKLDKGEAIITERKKYEKACPTSIQNLSVSVNDDGRSGLQNDLKCTPEEQQQIWDGLSHKFEENSKINPAERDLYNLHVDDRERLKLMAQFDPDVVRYIYRQRPSSPSRYPNSHYHCKKRNQRAEFCNTVPHALRRGDCL